VAFLIKVEVTICSRCALIAGETPTVPANHLNGLTRDVVWFESPDDFDIFSGLLSFGIANHDDPRMEMNLTKTAQHYGGIIELTLQKVRYSLRGRFSHANEQSILKNCCRRIDQERS